jgi:hypothetical protein
LEQYKYLHWSILDYTQDVYNEIQTIPKHIYTHQVRYRNLHLHSLGCKRLLHIQHLSIPMCIYMC